MEMRAKPRRAFHGTLRHNTLILISCRRSGMRNWRTKRARDPRIFILSRSIPQSALMCLGLLESCMGGRDPKKSGVCVSWKATTRRGENQSTIKTAPPTNRKGLALTNMKRELGAARSERRAKLPSPAVLPTNFSSQKSYGGKFFRSILSGSSLPPFLVTPPHP